MGSLRLDRILELFTGMGLLVILLWLGLAVLTVGLLVLVRTRWGRSHQIQKCLVLSILAHLLFVGYATMIPVLASTVIFEEPVVQVSFVDDSPARAASGETPAAEQRPWDQFPHESVSQPEPADPTREQAAEPEDPKRHERPEPESLPDEPSLDQLALAETERPKAKLPPADQPSQRDAEPPSPEAIEVPPAERREAATPALPGAAAPPRPAGPVRPVEPPPQAPSAGIPNELKQPPGPLPGINDPPTTPDPAKLVAGPRDRLDPPPPGPPVGDAFDSGYGGARPGGELEPAAGGAGRPLIPPIDALAGNFAGGGIGGPALPPGDLIGPPKLPSGRGPEGLPKPPAIYSQRTAANRAQLAQQHGATPETEAAVKAALQWLARSQAADGRWDASDYGAGRETLIEGRNRGGAGIEADTAMTGLALLAFLASGHTHRDGEHRETVRRGLEYLMRTQGRDGNLAGRATPYARMYCHAIAAFALSEAYGMSGDPRLRGPVERAVGYTVAAQSPTDGGWRYVPGDPGDTSQIGWQWMALKSADLAGVAVPESARRGINRFLRTVSAGTHGGLASYRPKERITRPMTAEAMVCWQFLGLRRDHPACNEAGDYLLGELPGQGPANFYYWYYATLAMYQLQGKYWDPWNTALQKTLLESQRRSGALAGSWDPDPVWGTYGGRVYSTALGALCLEVYYRFLPLYVEAGGHDRAR